MSVFVPGATGTVIAHNEITSMPYSGMSIGWGWGEEDAGGGWESYFQPYKYATPTPAKDNRIEYNHIHGVMKRLNDGGGIYMLSNQPGTIVRGNHVHDNGDVKINMAQRVEFTSTREAVSSKSSAILFTT